MNRTTYSDPRVTREAKGLMENPPRNMEYAIAVDETVAEVVAAIRERIDREVASKISKERN